MGKTKDRNEIHSLYTLYSCGYPSSQVSRVVKHTTFPIPIPMEESPYIINILDMIRNRRKYCIRVC